MEVDFKKHITIYNNNEACVANVSIPILGTPFFESLFLTSLRESKAIVALIMYPSYSSSELECKIKEIESSFRMLEVSYNDKLVFDCMFSLIYDDKTNFKFISELLTLACLEYDSIQFYFSTDISELQYQEKIIKKSIIKPAFNNKKLESYFSYSKFESDNTDIFIYNNSEVSFHKLFTPNPITTIQSLLNGGVLYNIDYSDEVKENKEFLDNGLREIGLPNSFDNENFEIDLRSNKDRLIFNIQKSRSTPIQLIIQGNYIEFNIDRVEYVVAISNREKNKQKLREKLELVFYSKVKVEYKGNDNSKIYFLDKNDRVVDKIIRCPFHNLFSKKEVFIYEPILNKK